MSELNVTSSESVEIEKLKLILEYNFISNIGNIGVAGLLTLIISIQYDQFRWDLVHIWLTYMVIISSIRIVYGNYLHKQLSKKNCFEEHYYFPLVILSAAGWASVSLFFLSAENMFNNVFIMLSVAGIVAGSFSSLTPIKHYFQTFIFLLLVPPILVFLFYNHFETLLFALMLVLYLVFMLKSGSQFSDNIEDNLKLNSDNAELIVELKKEKEKALAASSLKSQFLANMSHEIRTPMNGIVGFIHLLEQQEKDPEKLKYLETIDHSTNDLLRIINDILDFSKIESNQLLIEINEFNPKDELESCLKLFQQKADQKQIELRVKIDSDLPEIIESDSVRIKQVINNLISNAIKFSPKNSLIMLTIGFDKTKEELTVAIKDQGIGISPEKIKIIFDPFVQADTTTTRKFGGTGLGLAISNRLAQILGGKLTVESKINEGSTFTFTAKTPVIEFGKTIDNLKLDNEDQPLTGHILIVEDNKVNQQLVAKLLDKRNLTYDFANDGIQAVRAYKATQYDLILMDINMPNMSGIDATALIRNYESENKLNATPIAALTANAMEGDRDKILASGMNEYLTKPINIQEFYRLINQYIKMA